MKETGKEIAIIDSLRAFAALSVCLFHFVCTTTGYIQNRWLLNLFSSGKFGVQLFFVISGFVIPWSMYRGGYRLKNFFTFFFKRLARLEPPYVFSVLLAVFILYLRNRYYSSMGQQEHFVDLKQLALHFFYLIPFADGYKWFNQVYWTLAVEFQYYFFMALIFPLIVAFSFGRYIFYLFAIVASFTSSAVFLPYWLPVFALGIVLFFYKVELIHFKEFVLVLIVLITFCFWYYPFASVIYALIPIAAILWYEQKRIYVLNFLGKLSYSIYLVHPLIGGTLINVLSHSYTSPVQKFFVIISGIMVTLAGAGFTYWVVEKPSRRFSASLKYRTAEMIS